MPRLRLFDLKQSDFPKTYGLCSTDTVSVANLANRVQKRLLYCREAGDEGWYGTFAEIRFPNVSRSNPFITMPRWLARVEALTVCNVPVPTNNQFLEYFQFGNGRMPQLYQGDNWCVPNVYQRNNAITFSDLSPTTYTNIRVYPTDLADVASAARVLLQGVDSNGNTIYTQDGNQQVTGEYLTLENPFVDSLNTFTSRTLFGIQKDITVGMLEFHSVDSSGNEQLLLTMEPGEQVAGYVRYYLSNLPLSCCTPTVATAQALTLRAICKLEPIPVKVDADYLILQNLEAMIEEAHSLRYSEMDSETAKKEALYHHSQAVRMLNGELAHYYGLNTPAVNFSPFGSAKLERVSINMR